MSSPKVSTCFRLFGLPFGKSECLVLRNGVKEYKYQAPNLSLMERVVLDPFWNHFVNVYPIWLAPNLITALGGVCILLGTILFFFYSSQGCALLPPWVFAACGVLLFAYQTLDGTDGKQARRTKSGSALGHIFDHGVDAVCGTLIVTWTTFIPGAGFAHPLQALTFALFHPAFFLSNMVNLHRGKQEFFNIDVMESECGVMGLCLFTAVMGFDIWYIPLFSVPAFHFFGLSVPSFVIELQFVATLIILSGLVQNSFRYITCALRVYLRPVPGHDLTVEGRGLKSLAVQVSTILLHSGLQAMNMYLVHTYSKEEKVLLGNAKNQFAMPVPPMSVSLPWFIVTVTAFAAITTHILVTTVSRTPFPYCHWGILVEVAFALAVVAGINLWVVAGVAVLLYSYFVHNLLFNIKQSLGIKNIFMINPPKAA